MPPSPSTPHHLPSPSVSISQPPALSKPSRFPCSCSPPHKHAPTPSIPNSIHPQAVRDAASGADPTTNLNAVLHQVGDGGKEGEDWVEVCGLRSSVASTAPHPSHTHTHTTHPSHCRLCSRCWPPPPPTSRAAASCGAWCRCRQVTGGGRGRWGEGADSCASHCPPPLPPPPSQHCRPPLPPSPTSLFPLCTSALPSPSSPAGVSPPTHRLLYVEVALSNPLCSLHQHI